MAKSPTAAKAGVSMIALATIAAASAVDPFFMYAVPEAVQPLIDDGTAELGQAPNPANAAEFPVRITPKGLEMAKANAPAEGLAPGAAASAAPARPAIIRLKGMATNKTRERRNSTSQYPFDDLAAPTEAGELDGFFIEATNDRPEPWKSLASTVSTAQQRFATSAGETPYMRKNKATGEQESAMRKRYTPTRLFRIVEHSYTDEAGIAHKGAWITRNK
ncbi:MAG: hypothetical protein H0U23_07320 [Blastocatellia bacterium]|nr:hypothetical protein [Blastocatellia bacterium]